MEHYDDPDPTTRDVETTIDDHETHATTGGAAVAGAVTGGVIGLTGGPVGAVVGAVGGAIVGAAAERMMHSDDDSEPEPAEHTPDTTAATTSDITTAPDASAGDRSSTFVERDEEAETR
jgi:outer membrane lipoprotein SlyB